MKKTLIALAVLAASGASFAQVAITGTLAMGYQADTTAANVASGGFGIDTSAINFTATEDLGNGMKAGAAMGIDGMNRAGIGGGDASMFLSGGFGKVTLSSARGSDYLSGGVAGVAGIGFDGKLFSALVATDALSYALPAFGPVTVSFTTEENAGATTAETSASGLGLGVGGAAAAGTQVAGYQRRNAVAVAYAAGALAANFGYQAYDRNTIAEAATNYVSRTRASVSYDLGMAKLGAGFDQRQYVTGTRMDTLIGVSVPMGALSFGAEIGARTKADTTGTNGTQNGVGLKAAYALSARTNVSYTNVRYDGAVAPANQTTYQAVLLSHSF